MRERIVGFIEALRQAGVTPSVSESLDAAAAVAALGVERPALRAGLAATLVKDEADRPAFDAAFDRYFAAPPRARGKAARARPAEEGEGSGGRGEGRGRRPEAEPHGAAPRPEPAERAERRVGRPSRAAQRLAERRALLARPFRAMDPREVEAAADLVEELARRFRTRWARRARRAPRGRLDMRRTIRRALGRGGVPIELLFRRPRPATPDLIALVDLSHSTATAAQFCLSLLAPARPLFRRVTLFAYVDVPVEISFEQGHVVPHAPLDLAARSDFGQVLRQLTACGDLRLDRNTVFLVLGDARNNRRPPRADLLAAVHARVRTLIWLNPEPSERWNTGDSVLATYAPHVDTLAAAWNLRTLTLALAQLAKRCA
jgi:hypothetical protein